MKRIKKCIINIPASFLFAVMLLTQILAIIFDRLATMFMKLAFKSCPIAKLRGKRVGACMKEVAKWEKQIQVI